MAKAIKGKVIFVNSPSLEALEKGFSLLKGYRYFNRTTRRPMVCSGR